VYAIKDRDFNAGRIGPTVKLSSFCYVKPVIRITGVIDKTDKQTQ